MSELNKCTFGIGQFSGIYDKNGRPICVGDKVRGLFCFGLQVDTICNFNPSKAAFGLEWQRGEVTEFNAFCQMCNIEYEVIGNSENKKSPRTPLMFESKQNIKLCLL